MWHGMLPPPALHFPVPHFRMLFVEKLPHRGERGIIMAKLFNLDQLPPMQTIDKHHQDPDFLYHELIATRELCQNLNEVMECSTDGLFVTDKNAIMLWINQAYEVITGVRREEITTAFELSVRSCVLGRRNLSPWNRL